MPLLSDEEFGVAPEKFLSDSEFGIESPTSTATTPPPPLHESLTADSALEDFQRKTSDQMMSTRIAPLTEREALAQEQARIAAQGFTAGDKRRAVLASGIEKGMAMPYRALRGTLDLVGYYSLLDKVLGTGTKNQDDARGWLEYYNRREQQLDRENKAMGATGLGYELAEGATRAAMELPPQIAAGAAGATRQAAVKASAIAAGAIAGLTQYAQDRGAGKGKLDAAQYAAMSGALTGLTTAAFGATGVESIFRNEGVKGVGSRILRVLKEAGFEGAEEAVDQFQQDLLERSQREPNKPIEQSVREIFLAGSIGTLLGGGVSAIAQTAAGPATPPGMTKSETEENRIAVESSLPPRMTITPEQQAELAKLAPQTAQATAETIKATEVPSASQITEAAIDLPTTPKEFNVEAELRKAAFNRAMNFIPEEGRDIAKIAIEKLQQGKEINSQEQAVLDAVRDWVNKAVELNRKHFGAWQKAGRIGGVETSPTKATEVTPPITKEIRTELNPPSSQVQKGGTELAAERPASLEAGEQTAPPPPAETAMARVRITSDKPLENATSKSGEWYLRVAGTKRSQAARALREFIKQSDTITFGGEQFLRDAKGQMQELGDAIVVQGFARDRTIKALSEFLAKKHIREPFDWVVNVQPKGGYGKSITSSTPSPTPAPADPVEAKPSPSPAGATEQTGLGAAVPSEFDPARKFTTKTTVEQINKERKERGLGPLDEHEVFGNKQAVAEAKKLMDENPDTAEQILARLRDKPETTLDPTERAVMVIHRAELLNSYYRALKNWREHFDGNDLVRAVQEAELADFYNKKLVETESLVSERGAGTAAGRSLQAIKMGITEDYSLEMMTLKAMKAKGESLTPEEGSAIVKEHERLQARIKKLEEELSKEREIDTAAEAQTAFDEAVETATKRKKAGKAKGEERDLEAEHKEAVDHLKEVFIEKGNVSGEATTIRKLMELLVEREGITTRLKMEDRVHEILSKEVDPTITREQAMDLMSNYGKSKLPSPEFAKKTVRDITAQILSVRKLLDYFKGERPKLTGQLRDAPSDIQRGLIKMVNEAKKAFKLEGPTDNSRATKSALDAINTRLKNRIADLKQEIATRQKIIRERNPSPYNAETLRMRAEVAELEKAHKEIFGKKELTDAQRLDLLEKSADRQIAELELQLRTGEIFPKSRIPFKGESERLLAARARLEELKQTREFAREAAQPRPDAEAASVEARVKSLDKQIDDIAKQISDEAVFPKGKTAKEPSTDARILERERKLSDLKEQRQFIRERIQPKPEQAAKELEQRAESLRKKIEEVQRQIRDGDIFPKGKKLTEVEKNDLIRARELELEALKEQRQWARESAQPKPEPEAQFLLNYLLRLRQREAAYRERIAKGDFEKRVKRPRELSPDVLRAKAEVEAAKQDFHKGVMQFEMARRTKLRKVWDGIKQTKNAFVNIKSSYDLSAPRQMYLAMLSNASRLAFSPLGLINSKVPGPKESAQLAFIPLGRMFEALKSEKRSQDLEQWRKTRPNATSGADKLAEIQYTELHTTDFTKWEENAHSVLDQWAQLPVRTGRSVKTALTAAPKLAAKGVRASNRAFITALNTQRAMLFDHLLETNFKDRAPTEAELKTLGNLVNISTGRGKLNRGVAQATGELLWSPSLFAARLQALTLQPLWGGGPLKDSARARWIVAKEYARWIISGTALYAISRMFDDDPEADSTSSDLGKIVRGNTRIDLWEGFQQFVVLEERLRKGKTTSIAGKTRDISGSEKNPGFGTGEVIWNFFKNKTRPDIAAIVKATIAVIDSRKPEKDVRVTLGEAAKSAIPIPLALQNVIEVMRDRGMGEGAIIQVLSTFGAGVNTYEGQEAQK